MPQKSSLTPSIPQNPFSSKNTPNKKKPKSNSKPKTSRATPQSPSSPSQRPFLQQSLLQVFSSSLPILEDPHLQNVIQQIKGHLYARDFAAAFGKEEYLQAYAARWSPSRAMAYDELFLGESKMARWLLDRAWRGKGEGLSGRLEHLGLDDGGSVTEERAEAGTGPETEGGQGECSGREKAMMDVKKATPSTNTLSAFAPDSETAIVELGPETSPASTAPAPPSAKKTAKIVCLGGGAGAELAGFAHAWAALLKSVHSPPSPSASAIASPAPPPPPPALHIHILDSAPWAPILSRLHSTLVQQISASSTQPGLDLASSVPSCSFDQIDLLDPTVYSPASLKRHVGDADLVTLFFTLNELYAASRGRTTALLLAMGEAVPVGARLAVVDSAGSYAGVPLGSDAGGGQTAEGKGEGGEGTRYPMRWLVDHTLLEMAGDGGREGNGMWRKVLGEDTRWFRREQGLVYPVPLADMRYQVHLYEKVQGM